jgi:hypothetical protein
MRRNGLPREGPGRGSPEGSGRRSVENEAEGTENFKFLKISQIACFELFILSWFIEGIADSVYQFTNRFYVFWTDT